MSRAASLYVGRTTHARVAPRPHAFAYGVFQILLDVDRLGEAARQTRLFRRGRFGLFSFAACDHGERDGEPLSGWIEAKLAAPGSRPAGIHPPAVLSPHAGLCVQPAVDVLCQDARGRLEAVIYEVNNTFGQTHAERGASDGTR